MVEGELEKPELSRWRKVLNWLCGIEAMQDSREPVFTLDEAKSYMQEAERQSSIEESMKGRILTSIGITFALSFTIFICGFFA